MTPKDGSFKRLSALTVKTPFAKERWALYLILAFTFLSSFMVPSRVQSLRRRLQSQAPELWAQVTNNGPFRITFPYKDLGFTDEGLYLARVRQIYLYGRPYGPWLGNRALKSWIFDCLAFYPIAAFIWICGGNLALGWTLAHAVIGCGWLLLLFFVFRKYSQDEMYSLMLSSFVFFFLNTLYEAVLLVFRFFRDPAIFISGLRNLPSSLFMPPSIYLRLPYPGVSYLWIAAGLAGALMLSRSPQRRPPAAFAVGAIFGFLCLVHLFEWICGVLTLCILAAALRREPDAPKAGRFNMTVAAVVAAAISGGYYIFAKHLTADTMRDMIDLNGAWGRHFSPLSIPFILSALLFWMLAKRREGARRLILLAAAAVETAAFLTANLPLALGYDMQFSDHASYLAAFTAILAVSCWTLEQENLKKYLRPHALVLTAFFCAWFAFKSKAWADLHYKFYGIPKDVAAAGEWLNANVSKDSLMLSLSAPINFLMPLETEMRSPVTFASANGGEAVAIEKNLRAFASLLKTLDVATARFRDERWRLGDKEELDLMARAEDLAGDMSWEAREKMLWQFFLRLDTIPGSRNRRREEVWSRILGYLQETEPLRTPFYAWIQKGDEPFLRRTPVESGGQLIYHNSSVSLYSFPNGVLTASAAPKRNRR